MIHVSIYVIVSTCPNDTLKMNEYGVDQALTEKILKIIKIFTKDRIVSQILTLSLCHE